MKANATGGWKYWWISGFSGLILTVATIALLVESSGVRKQYLVKPLLAVAPSDKELPDWRITAIPIAESPEIKAAVAELLNYDDAIQFNYEKAGVSVMIYAAYWRPEKMSYRAIQSHTPDQCWIGAGWELKERMPASVSYGEGSKSLPVAGRIFQLKGVEMKVLFCHLLGGRVVQQDENQRPRWYVAFADLFEGGMRAREEQLFFRVSGNVPLADLRNLPPVRIFLDRLFVEWRSLEDI